MNFRIIAIRTGTRLEGNYDPYDGRFFSDPLKVLSENEVYSFCRNYIFTKGDFSEIVYEEGDDMPLYNIQLDGHKIEVNISAVVGGNGSGKSTLMELLYAANYNIGCQFGLLSKNDSEDMPPSEMVNLEILYSVSNFVFYKLKFENRRIFQQKGELKSGKISFSGRYHRVINPTSLRDYFYTIAINYSHYALNSIETGGWITQLFHKNDGYQTPVVLNPMRTEGIIDINREKHLLTRRLVANLLEEIQEGVQPINSLRNLANGKIAKTLRLKFSENWHYKNGVNIIFDGYSEKHLESLKNALKIHFDIGDGMDNNDSYINDNILAYIYSKLVKISKTYQPYYKYAYGKKVKNIDTFLKQVKTSNSHIVFKLKGAILFLKYQNILLGVAKLSPYKAISVDINKMASAIAYIKSNELFWINTFMMAPPSFFDVEIIPENGMPFDAFSSGEKQRMHSISSIVYHLINLNSVEQFNEKQKENWVSYQYINIVLDEIELYYHPEWQRRYISDLLCYIEKISLKNLNNIKGVNFTFLTHSPFILSDIPSNNILFLQQNGKPQSNDFKVKTFGANIHDLLKHSFFLDTGSMGEYAKNKISQTIRFINEQKDLNLKNDATTFVDISNKDQVLSAQDGVHRDLLHYHKSLISIIDEPILKRKLSEMFDEISGEDLELILIQKKIDELQSRAAKLKKP